MIDVDLDVSWRVVSFCLVQGWYKCLSIGARLRAGLGHGGLCMNVGVKLRLTPQVRGSSTAMALELGILPCHESRYSIGAYLSEYYPIHHPTIAHRHQASCPWAGSSWPSTQPLRPSLHVNFFCIATGSGYVASYLAEPIWQHQTTWKLDGVCERRRHGVCAASSIYKRICSLMQLAKVDLAAQRIQQWMSESFLTALSIPGPMGKANDNINNPGSQGLLNFLETDLGLWPWSGEIDLPVPGLNLVGPLCLHWQRSKDQNA